MTATATRPQVFSRAAWSPREIEQLRRMATNLQREELVRFYQAWAKARNLPERSRSAIFGAASIHGISLAAAGATITPKRIAKILGVGHSRIERWLQDGLPHSRPRRREGSQQSAVRYVRRAHLVAFAREKPEHFGGIPRGNLYMLLRNMELATSIAERFPVNPTMIRRRSIRVRCVETGQEYESLSAAAKAMFVTKQALDGAIARGGKSAGYHWEKIDEQHT